MDTPEYPSDDARPQEFARYARLLWLEQEEAMAGHHDTWIQNILFLTNRQWWVRKAQGSWVPQTVPKWRKQPVSNLTLAFHKTVLAKVTKNRPALQVIPASAEPTDVEAAALGEEVLEAKWIELNLGRVIRRAVSWVLPCGNAFLYPYWNENSGKLVLSEVPHEVPLTDANGDIIGTELAMVPADEDGNPQLDKETGLPKDNPKEVWVDQGEIGIRVLSPFQVRVNPEAESDEDVTWMIVAEPMTLREIHERWPDSQGQVHAEEIGQMEHYERLMAGVLGAGDQSTALITHTQARDWQQPKALVHHYHERPNVEYPGGRFWISVNDDYVLEEVQDLPDGVFPLIHMEDVQVPGQFYSAATMSSIIGLNREYNEINAVVAEHHSLLSKGKWMNPKGSGVTKGMITNEPGEVITHNPGLEPKQAKIEPLPEQVSRERDRVLNDIEYVGGVHKISMGAPPPGVTAGVAFLQLQEADDTDLGPMLAMMEESVAKLGRAMLTIIGQRYEDERLIYVAGPNRKYMVKSFKGSQLDGVVDVIPVTESSQPWSKVARQSMILDLAKGFPGLFTDPLTGVFDKASLLKHLPIGGLDSMTTDNDLDAQEAKREEEMFEEDGNEYPMVEFWQNHAIHYQVHISKLKSAAFREDWSPEAQQALKTHAQQHLMQLQGMAQQPTAPAPGGEEELPPEPGGSGLDIQSMIQPPPGGEIQ